MRKLTLLFALLFVATTYLQAQNTIRGLEDPFKSPQKSQTNSTIPQDYTAKEALTEDFEGSFPPYGWWLIEGTGNWDKSTEIEDHTTGSGAFARYACYDINGTEPASLVSPALDVTEGDTTFSFWVNYYFIDGDYGEAAELYVDVSTDFGETWTEGTTNIITDSAGVGWFQYEKGLGDYTGEPVVVRLRAVSDYGSYNIAVDDVSGPEKYVAPDDVGITEVTEPQGLLVTDAYDIRAILQNFGTNNLTSATIATNIRDTVAQENVFSETYDWSGDLATAATQEVTPLPGHSFSDFGVYNIEVAASQPNGSADPIFTNNSSNSLVKIIEPGMLFQDFEEGEFPSNWIAEEDWLVYSYSGLGGAFTAGIAQQDGDPIRKLITPQLSVESGDKLIFLLGGNLNDVAAENNLGTSSLTIKYASSPDGSWTTLQSYDMADEGDAAHYVSLDLSDMSAGDYYFAFETESDFSYSQNPDLRTYVFVDDIMGPVKTNMSSNDLMVKEVNYDNDFIYEGGEAQIQAIIKNVGLNEQSGSTVTFQVDGEQVGTASIDAIKYLQQDTVSVNWTATERGKYEVTAAVEADDNTANDSLITNGTVVEPGQMIMGFEDSLSADFQAWNFQEGWYQSGADNETFGAYQGDSLATCVGDADGGAYEDVKLITQKLTNDQHFNKIYFYAKGINLSDTTETTLQLKYTQDTTNDSWSVASSAIDMTENWQLYEFDLSGVPNGDIFFAFSASSNWEYQDYVSYVMLDKVEGISYLRPGVQYAVPYNDATGIPLDSSAIIQFEEEITVNDLSGITITGETEGEVSNVTATMGEDNKTITITHDPYANNNEVYTVNIPYNTVENAKHAGNLQHSWSFTTIMLPPEGEQFFPASGAEGVALDADVSVKLNQQVTANDLSNVTITGATEGEVGNVTASLLEDGRTIAISHDDFANMGEAYTVTIPAGAVSNSDQVDNEEISWTFTTKTAGQPAVAQLFPANNSTEITVDSTLYVVFDMAVTENDLSGVSIADSEGNQVSNVSPSLINANNSDADTLMIAHDAFTKYGELYTATVPAGAVTGDGADNGLITWSFTTLIKPPQVDSKTPADQATGVSLTQSVYVTFDQTIMENDFSGITLEGETTGEVSGLDVQVVGSTQLYILHDDFINGETYNVHIPADAVKNEFGATNTDVIDWSFTTVYPEPELVSTTPADSATNQPLSGELMAKFSTSVDSVDFSEVTLYETADSTLVSVEPYLNSADTAVVIPYSGVNYGTQYTAYIPAGAVANPDGTGNEAVSWMFTTISKYTVTFNVTHEDNAVEGATITFGDGTLVTNADGIADTSVVNGSYDYSVEKADYETVSGTVTVDGSDVTEDIALQGAYTLTFNVEDEEASAVEGAWVKLVENDDSLETNADGVAEFMHLLPGTFNYEVNAEGYEQATGSVDVSADTTVTVALTPAVGINNFEEAGISVYPNPSDGQFNLAVEHAKNTRIRIIDLSGAIILEKEIGSRKTVIDIKGQKSGIYILEVMKGDNTYSTRIVKH